MKQPEYLTIVYEVKSPEHRTQLLSGQWESAAHGHVIAELQHVRKYGEIKHALGEPIKGRVVNGSQCNQSEA